MRTQLDKQNINTGANLVLNYLKGVKRGSVLVVNDFSVDPNLSYTNIRSILVHLCKRGVLMHLGFGIYCYPKYDQNKQPIFPSVYSIITRIAKRDNYDFCPSGEYAEYLMGLRSIMPQKVICYNNQKTKSYLLENGVSVIIKPGSNYFKPFIKSAQLRMLVTYIKSKHVDNISSLDRLALIKFYNNIDKTELKSEASLLPQKIREFLILE